MRDIEKEKHFLSICEFLKTKMPIYRKIEAIPFELYNKFKAKTASLVLHTHRFQNLAPNI